LTEGSSYEFYVVALNKHGTSDDSPTQEIKASGVPETMAAPIVRDNGIYASITWTAPDGNGETITSYLIEIKTKTSTWA